MYKTSNFIACFLPIAGFRNPFGVALVIVETVNPLVEPGSKASTAQSGLRAAVEACAGGLSRIKVE
mgnify:CR=1 FL=1